MQGEAKYRLGSQMAVHHIVFITSDKRLMNQSYRPQFFSDIRCGTPVPCPTAPRRGTPVPFPTSPRCGIPVPCPTAPRCGTPVPVCRVEEFAL